MSPPQVHRFFTASGQKPFTQSYIVTTNNDWSDSATDSRHDSNVLCN